MLKSAILVCLLPAALSLGGAYALRHDPAATSIVHAAQKNDAETVFASAAPKVVFLITRKSGELHARASGVILTADGYIATNYHALQGADAVEIRFFANPKDSEDYQSFNGAKLLFADPERDIAILKVTSNSLPFLECSAGAGCEPRVGETVFAIGNPRGLTNSISEGIVSALRMTGGEDIIQHTAPISPGSSGGALVDSTGNLLGINSWQVSESQNLNFAISAKHVMEALRAARHSATALRFPPDAVPEVAPIEGDETTASSRPAIEALRELSQSIKACPQASLSEYKWGKGATEIYQVRGGPPENVIWDASPSDSARAPYSGYIQFIVRWALWVPPDSLTKFIRKFPALWEAFQQHLKPIEYRYEFDVGPDRLELVKIFSRNENETEWKTAELPNWCWGHAARNIQTRAERSRPRNRTAIQAEFVEIAASSKPGTINFWYALTNTTDDDYRIDTLSEITTAGWVVNDSLYEFNQGISFEVPVIIPAHRRTLVMLHADLSPGNLSVPDGASESAISVYRSNVMKFLQSNYAASAGFAILDERRGYEIDFPLPKSF